MSSTTTAAASPAGRADHRKLTGSMSTFDIVFTVLAFAGPLAVFAGYLTVIIGYGNGFGAPLTQVLIGTVVLLFAVGFTGMSKHLPNPGGFYAYVTAGLGRPLGLGAAFLALVAYGFLLIQCYIFLNNQLKSAVVVVFDGPDIPSWVFYVPLVAIVAILGYLRIALSAKVLAVALFLEVIILVAFDIVVLVQGGNDGYTSAPFDVDNVFSGSFGLAALFCIGTFIGFEATAIFREEARDPEKTVPRATYITIGVIAVLYSVTSYVLIIAIGPDDAVAATAADPAGAASAAVADFLGSVGQDIFLLLVCNSIFATVLASHNITARYLFSMGRDGVLPRGLGRVHDKHDSPYVASLLTTAFAGVFLLVLLVSDVDSTTLYAKMGGIAVYLLIALFVLTSIAIPAYFWAQGDTERSPWKTLIAPALGGAGFATALVLATQNAAFLVGGTKSSAVTLVVTFAAATLVAGVALALVLRRTRPDVYARLGRQDI